MRGIFNMATKKRMGNNPLDWIGDSRKQDSTPSKPSTQSNTKAPFKKKAGRPKTNTRVITSANQEGLKEGWTRKTFIVRENWIERIKDLAYWDRLQHKEALDQIMEEYFKQHKVKPRPANKRN